MSRERQIAAGGLYLIPTVAGNLIPVLTLPIFTRYLPPAEYGRWALATAYATFVTGLANFGLTLAYERNFFECENESASSELLYSVLSFVFGAYLLCAAGTWAWRAPIARWLMGSAAGGSLLFWVFAANGLSSLKYYYLTYLRNTGDARGYVWFTMDETILTAVFSLFLVVAGHAGIMGLPWGQFAGAGIVFVFVSARFARRLRPRLSAARLRDSLKLGYPITPRIFLGVWSNNFDKYLLGLLSSMGNVGVYAIGQRIAYVMFGFMTALENVFAPEVYRRMFSGAPEAGRSIGRYLTPFIYLSFGVGLLIALFAEEALYLLTPRDYHGAVPIVMVLTLYYASMFFGKQPQLVYARKTFLLSVLTVVTLGVTVLCTLVSIEAFGFVGAAVGTLAAGLASVALYNAVAWRYYRIRWELKKIAVFGGILTAACLGMLALIQTDAPYGIRLGLKLVAVAAYLAAGAQTGIMTVENLRVAWSAISSRVRRPSVPTSA